MRRQRSLVSVGSIIALMAATLIGAAGPASAYAATLTPTWTVALATASAPTGLAVDATGNAYVTNGGTSITVYDSAGALLRTISGDVGNGLGSAQGVGIDGSGLIYVADNTSASIKVFAADASGASTPLRTIVSTGVMASPRALAVDTTGNVWVAVMGDQVLRFDSGRSGDVAPDQALSGAQTGLHEAAGLAVSAGSLYVANSYTGSDITDASVTVYLAGDTGDVAPQRTIQGADTGLSKAMGVAVDSTGVIYVGSGGNASVEVFASTASGNVAPAATLAGATSGFGDPSKLALTAGDRMVLGYGPVGSIALYPSLGGLTPVLTPPTPATGGFGFEVSNYDPAFDWTVTTTVGSTSLTPTSATTAHVNVAGLGSGGAAAVTVTASRTGYPSGSSTTSGQSVIEPLPTLLPPSLSEGEPTSRSVSFRANFCFAAQPLTWSASTGQSGRLYCPFHAYATIDRLLPGQSVVVTVRESETGFLDGVATITLKTLLGSDSNTADNAIATDATLNGDSMTGIVRDNGAGVVYRAGDVTVSVSPQVVSLPAPSNAPPSTLRFSSPVLTPGEAIILAVHVPPLPVSRLGWLVASTPTPLGSITTDQNGNATLRVQLPAGIEPGAHHLVLEGLDENGPHLTISIPITITAKAALPAAATVAFADGRTTLTAKARTDLTAAVRRVPADARSTSTIITVTRPARTTKAQRQLAADRGQAVKDALRKAGITGPIAVTTAPVTKTTANQATICITFAL